MGQPEKHPIHYLFVDC